MAELDALGEWIEIPMEIYPATLAEAISYIEALERLGVKGYLLEKYGSWSGTVAFRVRITDRSTHMPSGRRRLCEYCQGTGRIAEK